MSLGDQALKRVVPCNGSGALRVLTAYRMESMSDASSLITMLPDVYWWWFSSTAGGIKSRDVYYCCTQCGQFFRREDELRVFNHSVSQENAPLKH